jgi:hypothetical protein
VNSEYKLTFFSRDNMSFPHALVERFEEGAAIAHYLLDAARDAGGADLALSMSRPTLVAHSLTLHMECRRGVGVLLQAYVPEGSSPAGEEGWYGLMEPRYHDRFSLDEDVAAVGDDSAKPDMIPTRLTDGFLFSRRMFVPLEMAIDSLGFFMESGDLGAMLTSKPWKFLGLI